jgi:hypothetical protein
MSRANGKLKKVTGLKKSDAPPMQSIPQAAARPGAWRAMLQTAPTEENANKHRHQPLVVDDAIVGAVADGDKASDIEDKLGVPRGYVRRVLIRRFGSIEGMKKALQAQCLENAIALNEYAMENIAQIPPGQAIVGAKIMIDGAIALDKNSVDRPSTVDFASLAALGEILQRVEKKITGSDRTILPVKALPA